MILLFRGPIKAQIAKCAFACNEVIQLDNRLLFDLDNAAC
jgi:hypothetical protein